MPVNRINNYKIEVVDLSDDTTVTPAGTDVQTLQPPVGFTYEVIDIGYQCAAPAGAGSGTHQLYGEYTGAYVEMMRVKSVFGSAVQIIAAGFNGDSQEVPSAAADQFRLMHLEMIKCSRSVPFVFTYTNGTDVNKTGTRTLIVIVKKRREAI